MTNITYSFVPMGAKAGTDQYPAGKNRVYLDVGNDIKSGILDHHQKQEGAHRYECATQIVADNPDLIFSNIELNPFKSDTIELILHNMPDFDCCAAAYLAKELIEKGKLPPGADRLAAYAADVDAGRKTLGTDKKGYLTPFSGVLFLTRHLYSTSKDKNVNLATVQHLLKLMELLCTSLYNGVAPDTPESLDWDDSPLKDVIPYIEADHEQYLNDIKDNNKCVEKLSIPVFRNDMTAVEEVDGLFINDPESVLFKYWSRGDTINSSVSKGFALLLCTYTRDNRTVISVDPNRPYILPYLGQILEIEEVTARRATDGSDKRLFDENGQRKKDRYHFNPDPWYDGRGHGFTIIDSPGYGSVLPSEKIREIVRNFYLRFYTD